MKVSKQDLFALKEKLKKEKSLDFFIITGSMEPLIKVGSKISVSPLPEKLKAFDILVYWDQSRLICHYLVHVNTLPGPNGERTVVTRGLAKDGEDFPVSTEVILGIVTNYRIGWLQRLLQSFRIWRQS